MIDNPLNPLPATMAVLRDVAEERFRQVQKWGHQVHPDGTGEAHDDCEYMTAQEWSDLMREECQKAEKEGTLTWRHISDEETAEAYAETDPVKLRKELIQQAAVLVAWIEDIDNRFEASRKAKP